MPLGLDLEMALVTLGFDELLIGIRFQLATVQVGHLSGTILDRMFLNAFHVSS